MFATTAAARQSERRPAIFVISEVPQPCQESAGTNPAVVAVVARALTTFSQVLQTSTSMVLSESRELGIAYWSGGVRIDRCTTSL